MTPRDRALMKVMFRRLGAIRPICTDGGTNREYLEISSVLADVLLESDRPEIGEALALAVQGRVSPYTFSGDIVGDVLPPARACHELAGAIASAERVLFPPRRAPCMPNRDGLRRLVEDAHGEGREAREWLRRLWREMEETCAGSAGSRRVLDTANSAIRGHGVESMVYRTAARTPYDEGRDVVAFDYVNMGDVYNETVSFIYQPGKDRTRRFLIATVSDVMEETEQRLRGRGDWGRW